MTEIKENLELEVIVNDEPLLKEVTFNYDFLKSDLELKLEKYKNLEVTTESMRSAKDDKANLNKLDAVLMKKGQEIDQKILGLFKTRLTELRGLVKSASNGIKTKVDELENIEKAEKSALIEVFYQENIGDLKEVLPLASIFGAKWLNKGTTIKVIEAELKQIVDTVNNDLTVINTLDTEFSLQVKDYYLRTRDLSGALAEKARLEKAKIDIAAVEQIKSFDPVNLDKDCNIIEPEKSEVDELDWANVSEKPKETSIKIIANEKQLVLIESFLNAHEIKYELGVI